LFVAVIHAMLGNAAVAAVLALFALALGRWCRCAAVRHAAWVIVLLKLVTPPLFTIPLPVLPASWAWAEAPVEPAASISFPAPFPQALTASPAEAASAPAWWQRLRPSGPFEWAVAAWALGSVAWFSWQGRRVVRFRRRVARAEGAPPEVSEAAARIAAALGITRVPAVKLAAGIGSPMLWGWGRGAVVLFPRDLLARLSPEARDTLLAHELAHYLRRDHWVRVLEFVATGLYWWHPVVWLAQGGIEAAEEECCDAWVVAGLASSPRRYAEALLATVDYEAELRRPRLPPGACAANRSARLLQRRLLGIINAERPRRLRHAAAIWVVVFAALLIRPVLRAAAAPEHAEPEGAPAASAAPGARKSAPASRKVQVNNTKKVAEPRSWATAAPAGGPTVIARDNEVLLRFADGTSKVLGPGRPLALAFAPGGKRIATAGPGNLLRTWDEHGELVATARTAAAGRSVAYTPDGSKLLVLDAAGEVTVRDPQTLAVLSSWRVEGVANSIACAPDSRMVAVSLGSWLDSTGAVELWSIPDGKKLTSYPASAPVGAARFTPDGRTLVIGGWGGLVAWRSVSSGSLLAERQLTKDVVASAAFSPDAGTLPLEPPPEPTPPPTAVDWPQNPVSLP
jgi:beta-lactamase regulating signal transducer with metallopeptidase domain